MWRVRGQQHFKLSRSNLSTAVQDRTCDLGPQGVLEVAVGHLALYRDQLVALGLVPCALCLLLSCPLQGCGVLVIFTDILLFLLFLLLVGLGTGTYMNPGSFITFSLSDSTVGVIEPAIRGHRQSLDGLI